MYGVKILNLYAGLGGNRRLWGDFLNIVSVEQNQEITSIYSDIYKYDTVIVDDAHEYLLKNYKNFDFIWSSPPCQSHSSFRQNICVRYRGTEPVYPDMRLYQEIIFLKNNFKGKWVVENVNPYYTPLIPPTKKLGRHLFWANFDIPDREFLGPNIRTAQIKELSSIHAVDLSKYDIKNKRQILRNCVDGEIGKHILQSSSVLQVKI